VIAVDLQHDAHLMQQDLWSIEKPRPEARRFFLACTLRARLTRMSSRRAATPTAMEIMSTSIQVLENRLKRNRMAGDPPDILIQPFCPQISTLDFHRAGKRSPPDIWPWKRKWMNYYPWCVQRWTRIYT
jgi:NTE family protein